MPLKYDPKSVVILSYGITKYIMQGNSAFIHYYILAYGKKIFQTFYISSETTKWRYSFVTLYSCIKMYQNSLARQQNKKSQHEFQYKNIDLANIHV